MVEQSSTSLGMVGSLTTPATPRGHVCLLRGVCGLLGGQEDASTAGEARQRERRTRPRRRERIGRGLAHPGMSRRDFDLLLERLDVALLIVPRAGRGLEQRRHERRVDLVADLPVLGPRVDDVAHFICRWVSTRFFWPSDMPRLT